MWWRVSAGLLAGVVGLACSAETRSLRLVRIAPAADPECGAPADARLVRVDAVGDFAAVDVTEFIDVTTGEVQLSRFPPTTRALEVQVLGEGGEQRVVGRTLPFEVGALDEGAELPVFMAPRRGFCPTGPPGGARDRPLVASIGDGVVVAGGRDEAGQPVNDVELYDPRTGEFSSLGEILYGTEGCGLCGATATAVSGHRVVFAGGPVDAFKIYDGDRRQAGPTLFFEGAPAHHAAVSLGKGRLFIAGGCEAVDAGGRCPSGAGASLATFLIDADDGEVEAGPPLSSARIGGGAIAEADGRVVLVGGVDQAGAPIGFAERIDPSGARSTEIIDGVTGAIAGLDGGGFLAVFARIDATAIAAAAAVAPGALQARSLTALDERTGASATALEDGRVAIIGGDPRRVVGGGAGAEALLYVPVERQLVELQAAPATRRRGHAAVRLGDGSVLVVGGMSADGTALGDAWILRPDLIGPFTSNLEITFEGERAEHVIPRDPARVQVDATDSPARLIISGSDRSAGLPSEWVVVAGPRFGDTSIAANASVSSGGIAVLVGFADAHTFAFVVLTPGQPAELLRAIEGQPAIVGCSGETVGADELRGTPRARELRVEARGSRLTAHIDGRAVLDCPLAAALPEGLVGLGVLGGAEDEVVVDRLSVGR